MWACSCRPADRLEMVWARRTSFVNSQHPLHPATRVSHVAQIEEGLLPVPGPSAVSDAGSGWRGSSLVWEGGKGVCKRHYIPYHVRNTIQFPPWSSRSVKPGLSQHASRLRSSAQGTGRLAARYSQTRQRRLVPASAFLRALPTKSAPDGSSPAWPARTAVSHGENGSVSKACAVCSSSGSMLPPQP